VSLSAACAHSRSLQLHTAQHQHTVSLALALFKQLDQSPVAPYQLLVLLQLHLHLCLCCRRWWACKPAATTSSTAAGLVIAATSGEVSAAASTAAVALRQQLVDILVANVPARASVSGQVFVTLTLNRQGSPVSRARVYVQVTTTSRGKSTTTTLPGVTKRDGTVKVAIPARARGVAGSRSTVEAFTIEARAAGAKGGVPVLSARKRVTWTA
jgi:hypothetical protein